MKKLKAFEDDLFNMIKNIKFTNFKSKYQRQVSRDLKELLSKKMVIIKSDKTSNLYYATPNYTTEYSISKIDPISKIKNEASLLLSKNNVENFQKITIITNQISP